MLDYCVMLLIRYHKYSPGYAGGGMKTLSLNRNQIKYVLIAAMLIDHIAWAFVPMNTVPGQIMHFIGRLTGPSMAYFLAEGYLHTRNVPGYAKRLGIFALLSWGPFCFFELGVLPVTIHTGHVIDPFCFYFSAWDISLSVIPAFGVIYTLLLGLLAIWLLDKGRCPKWCKILGIIGLCILSVFGDWPVFDILYAVFFFIFRENTKKKWIAYSVISVCTFVFGGISWEGVYQIGVFMVPFLIQFCYNGEIGSRKPVHKWFFYVFYPAHLLVLGVLAWL